MNPADHAMRIHRIQATMQKVDPLEDYELFLECCMLAGTHGLNLILHRLRVTPDERDLAHTDTPAHQLDFPGQVSHLVAGLRFIESIRPDYLRGNKEWTADEVDKCRAYCSAITEHALALHEPGTAPR